MRTRIRPLGIVLIICALLIGCANGGIELSAEPEIEEMTPPAAEDLVSWHRVDRLDLPFYADDGWAEEVSTADLGWKTIEYPISDSQYYTVSVYEQETEEEDLDAAAESVAEELELTDSGMMYKNTQIQTKGWTNGNVDGKLVSYLTKYEDGFYSGYKEGYRDIIQDDTSYGKILVILDDHKLYQFRMTAYRDEDAAFRAFDRLTSSIGMS